MHFHKFFSLFWLILFTFLTYSFHEPSLSFHQNHIGFSPKEIRPISVKKKNNFIYLLLLQCFINFPMHFEMIHSVFYWNRSCFFAEKTMLILVKRRCGFGKRISQKGEMNLWECEKTRAICEKTSGNTILTYKFLTGNFSIYKK